MCFSVQPNLLKSAEQCSAPVKRSSRFTSESLPTFTVPTFPDKPIQSIEITELTSSEIASLKENDPFMYYSIPAARTAAMVGKDLDPSLLRADAPSSDLPYDSEGRTQKARKVSCKITKQRRLSMEMHPDALLEEMINDADFMSTMSQSSGDSIDGSIDFGDSLLSLFEDLVAK